MRKIITLIITGLMLVVAVPAMAMPGTEHQIPSSVSIQHSSNSKGDVFVGHVFAANGVVQSGRKVYLYSTYDKLLGTSMTGSCAGHSKNYWQVPVTGWAGISQHHFDAYVQDRFAP
ncbi:MAG: hypothetical protein ACXVHK_29100 [Solirubrobacteraceae bacterium]